MRTNRTIRVVASVSVPYVVYNEKTGEFSGILIRFIRAACHRLSYICILSASSPVPDNRVTGDEALLGMFGDIVNGTADVGVSPISITAKRFSNFSFIDSFMRRTYVAVVHEKHILSVLPSNFILDLLRNLLTFQVWICIAGVFVAMVLLGSYLEFGYSVRLRTRRIKSLLSLLNKWTFRMIGTGLGIQGIEDFERTNRIPSWRPSRIIFALTWAIYTFFVISALGASLPSVFTFAASQRLPFSSVKQLTNSDFIPYGTTTVRSSLNASKNADHIKLAKQIQLLPDATANATKYERYVELSQSGKSVLIIDLDALLEISYFNCEMIVAIDNLVSIAIAGLITARDSPLQASFEYGYSLIKETGYAQMGVRDLDRFVETATHTHHLDQEFLGSCFRKKLGSTLIFKHNILRFETLQFLFWFFAGGLITATVVGFGEFGFYRAKVAWLLEP
ncbi:hypothetical protein BV898_02428 [Hypsibius exemplaris]|uniref:Ionotropic glutamate receptor C-terminal domain-containing protein n=1 Tax=Hypsibius exemplaris TaxID=2072580 RepID=A0A1W0X8U5_HYPEX|nr:hypothetical protein BV898_02428 [Hypsibius exemplaris]